MLHHPKNVDGKNCQDGHKLFRCNESGQLAIADWSGRYPDQTDDGILFVSTSRPVVLSLSEFSAGVLGDLPVWSLREQRVVHTLINLDTLQAVQKHMPEVQVVLDAKLAKTVQSLLPYAQLAVSAVEEPASVG
jgi:hypothetical protein